MAFEFKDGPEVYYRVLTEFRGGDDLVEVYRGTSQSEAEWKTNFWDAKQNTWLREERLPMDYLSVAMRKFDALERYISDKADKIAVMPEEMSSGILSHASRWH